MVTAPLSITAVKLMVTAPLSITAIKLMVTAPLSVKAVKLMVTAPLLVTAVKLVVSLNSNCNLQNCCKIFYMLYHSIQYYAACRDGSKIEWPPY